jgi:hypothetical protein
VLLAEEVLFDLDTELVDDIALVLREEVGNWDEGRFSSRSNDSKYSADFSSLTDKEAAGLESTPLDGVVDVTEAVGVGDGVAEDVEEDGGGANATGSVNLERDHSALDSLRILSV